MRASSTSPFWLFAFNPDSAAYTLRACLVTVVIGISRQRNRSGDPVQQSRPRHGPGRGPPRSIRRRVAYDLSGRCAAMRRRDADRPFANPPQGESLDRAASASTTGNAAPDPTLFLGKRGTALGGKPPPAGFREYRDVHSPSSVAASYRRRLASLPVSVAISDKVVAELLRMEEDCTHSGKAHFNAATRWTRWNYAFGIPSVGLSALAGGAPSFRITR